MFVAQQQQSSREMRHQTGGISAAWPGGGNVRGIISTLDGLLAAKRTVYDALRINIELTEYNFTVYAFTSFSLSG